MLLVKIKQLFGKRSAVKITAQPNKLLDTSAKQLLSYHVACKTLACVLPVSRRVNAAVRFFVFAKQRRNFFENFFGFSDGDFVRRARAPRFESRVLKINFRAGKRA
jgi:hypothetical protein